ncbi:MAG: hypothetical protein M1819_001661 [Sarea resinae]|nr:MAG: hypothetical protein M1819_001661 [Sarea resinae]
MQPYFSLLLTCSLFLTKLVSASSSLPPRADDAASFSLYAYGSDIEGLPIFYGDGVAYTGYATPPNVSQALNVTCQHNVLSFSSSSLTAPVAPAPNDSTAFQISPNSSANWTSKPRLAINIAPDAFDPVKFLSPNATLSDDQIASGFRIYGKDLAYLNSSSGKLQEAFWASNTSQSGAWVLRWNVGGQSHDGSVPVVVKTMAPSKPSH